MTSLKMMGYKKVTVEKRSMTLGELKLRVLRAYMIEGEREVQLINITSGDTVTFKTSEDVLRNEWLDDYNIEIINLPHSYGIGEEESKTIIIFQETEDHLII